DFDARKGDAEGILARRITKSALDRDRRLYLEVAAASEPPEGYGVDSLADELSRRADLAFVYDENERRASSAIYANENMRLRNSVFARSIGFRLAALLLELGQAPRHEIVRDAIEMLSQQIDQLDQNGGRHLDVQILRACVGILRDGVAASAQAAK